MKCFVYYNLHRECWSIKALEGERKGRVIGHAYYVYLADVTYKVSEAGRQRVLRDKKKNVHAGAVGTVERWNSTNFTPHGKPMSDLTLHDRHMEDLPLRPDMVTYDPYKGPTFTDKDTGEVVRSSASAFLCPDRRVYVYGRA